MSTIPRGVMPCIREVIDWGGSIEMWTSPDSLEFHLQIDDLHPLHSSQLITWRRDSRDTGWTCTHPHAWRCLRLILRGDIP